MYWYVGLNAIIYLVNAQLLNQTVVLSVVTQGFCALMKDCVARNCRQIFCDKCNSISTECFSFLELAISFFEAHSKFFEISPCDVIILQIVQ